MKTNSRTTLPIAFTARERSILQEAARQSGQPESTYVRNTALVVALKELYLRDQLEQRKTSTNREALDEG